MVDKKKLNLKKGGKVSKPSTLPVSSKTGKSVNLKMDKKDVGQSKIIPKIKDVFKDYYQKD
jgi:hypothetical protein